MRDGRTGAWGRLTGTASFIPAEGFLRFSETGLLAFGGVTAQAARDYRFEILGARAFRVSFADGRFFHEARVEDGTAEAAHDCAPDLYRGRYRFDEADRWRLSWRVTGPRKDLVICSVFSRQGGGQPGG